MELLNLSKLKILVLKVNELFSSEQEASENCPKITQALQKNCILQELKIELGYVLNRDANSQYIVSVMNGIKANKTVKLFSICTDGIFNNHVSAAVVCLLKENHTLNALKMHAVFWDSAESISIPTTLKIINTPLNAIDIRGNGSSWLRKAIIQSCKTLHYVGYDPFFLLSMTPSDLFKYQPGLQQLEVSLNTIRIINELLSILKHNSTLTVLQVKIESLEEELINGAVIGINLRDMLKHNKKIQHFAIILSPEPKYVSHEYMPYLTAGLKDNSTILGLRLPISLSQKRSELAKLFFSVLSSKKNLTELHLDIFRDECDRENDERCDSSDRHHSDEKITELYCSQVPLVTKMLKRNVRMKLLEITFCSFYRQVPETKNITPTMMKFMVTACSHPSLKYLRVPKLLGDDEEIKVINGLLRIGKRVPSVYTD